jgi:hypothetical protein
VVDVAEDRDDRTSRAFFETIAGGEPFLDHLRRGLGLLDLQFDVVLDHDLDRLLGLDRGIDGGGRSDEEQLLENVRGLHAGGGGEFLDGDRLRDLDRSGRLLHDLPPTTATTLAATAAAHAVLTMRPEEALRMLERLIPLEHVLRTPWLERLIAAGSRATGSTFVASRTAGLATGAARTAGTTAAAATATAPTTETGVRLHAATSAAASAGAGTRHHAAARRTGTPRRSLGFGLLYPNDLRA